jgi:hydroxypyruvate isomerase
MTWWKYLLNRSDRSGQSKATTATRASGWSWKRAAWLSISASWSIACEQAKPDGRTLLIEPINGRDMPGYFLSRQDDAHAVIAEVGADNLKVQMDLYHCQIVEGDVAMKLRQYLPTGRVGHLQIAGVPERHEPDVGEQNYGYLFGVIDEVSAQCGWQGWVGCEYRPRRGMEPGGTSAGLGWLRDWRQRA